jgi:ABC-2 type transport system ATP-binding protein
MTHTLSDQIQSIVARNLRKSFHGVPAVNDVSFQVAGGEIYGLVGPDGAGKTTLLRLLVGALRADAGEAIVGGIPIRVQPEEARAGIGYLSQRFSLYEELTVIENIRFFAEVRGLRAAEWYPRCLEILDFVGLAGFKNRRAGQLSGGMKQKLGLASALVSRPRVLLLDEPTTGVDPVTRQDFWQLIIRLVAAPALEDGNGGHPGVAIVITTPYMDEASRCNRLGFMLGGRIIAEGTPTELRSSLSERIVELTGPDLHALREEASQDPEVEDVHAFGDRLHLRVRAGRASAVMERLNLRPPIARSVRGSARLIPATLEDVFMALSLTPESSGPALPPEREEAGA